MWEITVGAAPKQLYSMPVVTYINAFRAEEVFPLYLPENPPSLPTSY